MSTQNDALAADYGRVESAIRYLAEHQEEQPSLEDLARAMRISPFHLQRLFKRWAGISPKRFLQYLTVEHAKALLEQSASVLDAAFGAGLSGPSRLHDHFVALEGVTPGEYKARGRNVTIGYGLHASPFGAVFLAETERGVCRLSFPGDKSMSFEAEELAARWPGARIVADSSATEKTVRRVFSRRSGDGPLSLFVQGTNFQIAVWKALLEIPAGSLTTYGNLAAKVGRPGAARAVGSAVGSNPVAFIVPCHRVIRAEGGLGGYRWGLPRKKALIAWESARLPA